MCLLTDKAARQPEVHIGTSEAWQVPRIFTAVTCRGTSAYGKSRHLSERLWASILSSVGRRKKRFKCVREKRL